MSSSGRSPSQGEKPKARRRCGATERLWRRRLVWIPAPSSSGRPQANPHTALRQFLYLQRGNNRLQYRAVRPGVCHVYAGQVGPCVGPCVATVSDDNYSAPLSACRVPGGLFVRAAWIVNDGTDKESGLVLKSLGSTAIIRAKVTIACPPRARVAHRVAGREGH